MSVYPSPWGGRVSKLRNTTKRFQPTETVTNPNVCALDDALMAVLPLESALARARWPSEHPFGRSNGPTAIQIAKTIAHAIGFVTESQSRSLRLPDHVALSRAKTAKTRSQTVCCKNHQRSVRCGRPRTPPYHGPAVAQNEQTLAPGRAQTAWERKMGAASRPRSCPHRTNLPLFLQVRPHERSRASPYRAQTFCGCPPSHARTLSNSMTALRSMASSVRNATWGVSTQFLAPASA